MSGLGLVFDGGGGKGAYQIGVWKALREYGLEKQIAAVSGTSVGALNAMLFLMGDYEQAESVWKSIDDDVILTTKEKESNEGGIFSRNGLSRLIDRVLQSRERSETCTVCYATCKPVASRGIKYFNLARIIDRSLIKKILLASSAIPVIFDLVEIDGMPYVDGGAGFIKDNSPVWPLIELALDEIIVVHLSDWEGRNTCDSARTVHLWPSESLGGIEAVIDFSPESICERMELGYRDAKKQLRSLADRRFKPNIKVIPEKDKEQTKKALDAREPQSQNNIFPKGEEEMQMILNDAEAKKLYEEKLKKLKKIANSPVADTDYLWDATVRRYAVAIERVRNMFASDELKDQVTSKMTKNLDSFLRRCSSAEFHIALVGAIKAGKSTLINALLGYEYASTKVTPETAALTKFKKAEKNYVKVTFYSADEWDQLWRSANDSRASVFLEEYRKLNADVEKSRWLGKAAETFENDTREELVREIMRWTSSKSATHYFVKEVEVGLKEFGLPEGVVLVDTPGLDDVVEYRSNITRDYIDRANAVLVCVKADALTGQEMATIYSVFANTRYNPEKVYIIATQQDTLNRPESDWKLQHDEWLKHLKEAGAYGSAELADRNLVSVSAYLYTLVKKSGEMDKDSDEFWTLDSILRKMRIRIEDIGQYYKQILDFTHIDLLKNKIDREIVTNYKKLLIDDIVNGYEICKEEIMTAMKKICQQQEEIIKVSQGGIEGIRKAQEEAEKAYNDAQAEAEEFKTLMRQLQNETKQRADELERSIKQLGGSNR